MGLGLTEDSRDAPPLLGMHRQHVDDVGPVVPYLVSVAEQAERSGELISLSTNLLRDLDRTGSVFG